jgi:hypothetical protein
MRAPWVESMFPQYPYVFDSEADGVAMLKLALEKPEVMGEKIASVRAWIAEHHNAGTNAARVFAAAAELSNLLD